MESFGDILRETRESKNISIETVVRETIISRQYVEALENEDITVFPGHTYVVGFLRTYCNYLEIDPVYLIRLFQCKIIQEAPVPEKLIVKPREISFRAILLLILGGIVFVTVIVLVFNFVIFGKHKREGKTEVDISHKEPVEITLSTVPLEKRLYKDDKIKIPLLGNPVELVVSGTLSVLTLETPVGTQFIELGEELEIDVDGQDGADIIVYLSDISKTDSTRGAEARMLMKKNAEMAAEVGGVVESNILSEDQVSKDASSTQTVLFSDNRAYPFTLKATFRGVCVFRSKADNYDAVEEFFVSGNTKTLKANNGVKIWMSNSNAAKLQIIADGKQVDLEIGRPGQVRVQEIRWIKEATGSYKLVEYEVN
ncbi:MAG TPA: helix-turn-helix domain-containing protein [Treponemataceae bacterium]|nr:helix-turn-helix domain-containing protein [Treponemataceae bacterium]